MPRIYTSASEPVDFCFSCFPNEDQAFEEFGSVGDGPDDRGNCYAYDSDHPEYSDDEYNCHNCKKPLTSADDYMQGG